MPWSSNEKRIAWEEKNKEERRKYKAEWHQKNKERINKKNQERKLILREEFREYKKTLKCSNCGFSHPAALDFHHKDGMQKDFLVSSMVGNVSFEKVKKEIDKCIVLCANCHRVFHYEQNKKIK